MEIKSNESLSILEWKRTVLADTLASSNLANIIDDAKNSLDSRVDFKRKIKSSMIEVSVYRDLELRKMYQASFLAATFENLAAIERDRGKIIRGQSWLSQIMGRNKSELEDLRKSYSEEQEKCYDQLKKDDLLYVSADDTIIPVDNFMDIFSKGILKQEILPSSVVSELYDINGKFSLKDEKGKNLSDDIGELMDAYSKISFNLGELYKGVLNDNEPYRFLKTHSRVAELRKEHFNAYLCLNTILNKMGLVDESICEFATKDEGVLDNITATGLTLDEVTESGLKAAVSALDARISELKEQNKTDIVEAIDLVLGEIKKGIDILENARKSFVGESETVECENSESQKQRKL